MEARVCVPTQLRVYTGGKAEVVAVGETLGALLSDLDRRYPGFRRHVVDEQDRVRRHILLYLQGEREEDLTAPVPPGAELFIIGALSGG